MSKHTLTAFLLLSSLTAASASDAIFIDNFTNGLAADSDSASGFWSSSTDSAPGDANDISESGGQLLLTAGDNAGVHTNNYSGVYINSDVSSAFNFFDTSLTFQVRGISFDGSAIASKSNLFFALTSTVSNSYSSPDAVTVAVKRDGTISLNSKVDDSNSDPIEIDSFDLGADNSVTGFDLTLAVGTGSNIDYQLIGIGGSGNTINGSFSLASASWGADGDSSILLWGQESNQSGGFTNFTVTVDSISVVPEPRMSALFMASISIAFSCTRRNRRKS